MAKTDLSKLKRPKIKLSGADGNTFSILGRVNRELTKAGWTSDQVKAFMDEARGGDYDHLLQTCMKYVDVE